MKTRLSKLFKLAIAWVMVFLLAWVVIELFFIGYIIRALPLSYQSALGAEGYILMQYSKRRMVPEHYVAILGDSYAYGQGEWMVHVWEQVRPDYSATQLIYKKTGLDTVSFGLPGLGSLSSIIAAPTYFLSMTNQLALYEVLAPDTFVVFFYEGNDLADNNNELRSRYLERNYDRERMRDEGYFNDFISREVVNHAPSDFNLAGKVSLKSNFLLARLAIFWFGEVMQARADNRTLFDKRNPHGAYAGNLAMVGGKEVAFGPKVSTPALELDSLQRETGIYVFQRALGYLGKAYPARRVVVYIPSVMSSYSWASNTVLGADANGMPHEYPRGMIDPASNTLCRRIEQVTRESGADFIDIRDIIRQTSAREMLHDPYDWEHFNRVGYGVLADQVSGYLQTATHTRPGEGGNHCASL